MAGSIPPLVSSSPPPLSAFDDDDEDDDDEFGVYNVAEDIDYNECLTFTKKHEEKQNSSKSRAEQDSTSQDSATDSGLCPDSEGMSPTPHSDDERAVNKLAVLPTLVTVELSNGHDATNHFVKSEEDLGNFEFQNAPSLSFEKDIYKETERSSKLPEEENTSWFHSANIDLKDAHSHKKFLASAEGPDHIDRISEIKFKLSQETVLDCKETFLPECSIPIEQSDAKDFEGIQKECNGNSVVLESEVTEITSQDVNSEDEDIEFDDFTDFKANYSHSLDLPETEKSDKISENSKQIPELEHSEDMDKCLQSQPLDESDDDFSNFADFSSSDCVFVSAQSSNSLESVSHIPFKPCDNTDLRTESEFQDWVSAFPNDTEILGNGTEDLLRPHDVVWTRLIPLESTPALSHQWADSLANRRLLTSLNIDSRNILCMPWNNSAVPRFAVNLSCGPLEPVKATEPLQLSPHPVLTLQPANTQESVPDAHFDWVGSGLTNPLDYSKPVLNLPLKTLSPEADTTLSTLPDLSFMRKTYIDFPINKG